MAINIPSRISRLQSAPSFTGKRYSQCLFSSSSKAQNERNPLSDLTNSLSSLSNRSASNPPSKPSTTSTRTHNTPPPQSTSPYKAANKFASAMANNNLSAVNRALRKTRNTVEQGWKAQDLERQMSRRWKEGDVYAPHDLSPQEMQKWKRKSRPTQDAFDALAINPLDEYKNFSILSEYMTDMGRIKHSSETGLRPVNQRRIAKAIRRAIGMGIMPSVHKHPELLQLEANVKSSRGQILG